MPAALTVRCLERSQLIRAATVTALAASVAWLPAQTVHQVGPGALPQITDAITIAAPGDIIEVASGAYRTFTCDKALTITAAPLAQVEIYPDFGFNVPPPANSYLHVAVLAADSTRAATFATAVPNAAGLRHTGIWLHAAALAASRFRVAAPVGGVLR